MKIAMAQLHVKAGCSQLNLQRMHEMILDAKNQQADLIIFPEMSVSGYIVSDKWLQTSFRREMAAANELIKSWSQGIGIIWGNIIVDEFGAAKINRDGRPIRCNAAMFAYDTKYVTRENGFKDGIYVKHCMPDYRFFDDSRYFMSGVEIAGLNQWDITQFINPFLFEKDGKVVRIGLEICEDLWSKDYSIDPTALYISQGVDFIVNISASPWTLRKELSRERRMAEHVALQEASMVPLIYVNTSGMQNTGKNVLMFDGDSTCYDTDGKPMVSCNDSFEEELCIFELGESRMIKPTPAKLLEALIHGIAEFDKQILGARFNWVIGLSGGLDSTINATLLVLALGKERVIGYNMASRFNQSATISIAKKLAEDLAIVCHEGTIEDLVLATSITTDAFGYDDKVQGMVLENVQARLRGHLLSTFAAIENAVICNNGNKVELAMGYTTLYGDAIGALSPLGDLTKVQLFEIAREINLRYQRDIIPQSLLPQLQPDDQIKWEIPPSAELKEHQLDPMKWYYHDWLVQFMIEYPTRTVTDVMDVYLSGKWRELPVAKWFYHYGLDNPAAFIEDLEWFMGLWTHSVFKRIQFPPILTISRGAFGSDFRESQLSDYRSADYETKKAAILALNQ
jgi:NAD+ synthase (glutamine-hydrolysing)